MEVDDTAVTLVAIRLGLMSLMPGGVLQADGRKGLLVIAQSEDGLTHVRWYKRNVAVPEGDPEQDSVVFPGECTLEQIPGQARCYVLQFPEDRSRDAFFWGQQAKVEEELELVSTFNKALRGEDVTPAPTSAPTPAPTPAPAQSSRAPINPDLAAILSSALSAAGAGAPPPASSDATPDVSALAASLLQQLAAQQGHPMVQPDQGPGLHEVLKPELVIPIVQQPGVLEQLAPHLPEEHRTVEELVATLRSPQFQQQVASFSVALQTGQLDLGQFGLQAKGFSVADFLEAVQDMVERQKGASGSNHP